MRRGQGPKFRRVQDRHLFRHEWPGHSTSIHKMLC
jgi:hypothetical protein